MVLLPQQGRAQCEDWVLILRYVVRDFFAVNIVDYGDGIKAIALKVKLIGQVDAIFVTRFGEIAIKIEQKIKVVPSDEDSILPISIESHSGRDSFGGIETVGPTIEHHAVQDVPVSDIESVFLLAPPKRQEDVQPFIWESAMVFKQTWDSQS